MAQIVTINGRQWLAGMSWSSYEDAPSKDELREDAQLLRSDWYTVRIGEAAVQAGFSPPIEGQKAPRKLYSLAAMMADSREQPWLGIFRIAEGLWWYIAVRDGHAILPDGDVIGGESEIHAARDKHSGYTDWKYIEGDINLLSEFMAEIGERPTPVKSLSSSGLPTAFLILLLIVVLAGGGGGYEWWHQKKLDEEHQRAVAMEKMREQLAGNKQIQAAPSPLLTTPEPNKWLAACSEVILKLPISKFGWTIADISCGPSTVIVNWLRQDGATVAKKPDGELSPEGDKIAQTIQLEGLDQSGFDNALDLQSEQLAMRAWAQSANLVLTLSQPAQAAVLPGSAANTAQGENPLPPPPPQSAVKFDVPLSPFSLDFSSIHGLRLNSLKSTSNGWSLEGVLYGK